MKRGFVFLYNEQYQYTTVIQLLNCRFVTTAVLPHFTDRSKVESGRSDIFLERLAHVACFLLLVAFYLCHAMPYVISLDTHELKPKKHVACTVELLHFSLVKQREEGHGWNCCIGRGREGIFDVSYMLFYACKM